VHELDINVEEVAKFMLAATKPTFVVLYFVTTSIELVLVTMEEEKHGSSTQQRINQRVHQTIGEPKLKNSYSD